LKREAWRVKTARMGHIRLLPVLQQRA